ncbi:HTH domain-containing protein [Marinobacterium sp. D7]|uniref:helix-turn-helix transcriptional regulator n=1 Tax=Marinobacterium ramblicola TaxID=2849041 RepID=UPI001C2D5649|nr:HTH domain-containing protein [Marinobacterium ramblicola]MBV1787503.1 HTH domain-containing protein [Marinobacterium ramblicola]
MSKAERLFNLYTLLRARRTAITADAIASALEVSVRTVYRDVQALTLSGVPIEGEPGVGYLLRPGYELPPLMFNAEEVLSLMVGIRMVRAFTDPDLARAAQQAEQKITSVLTEPLKARAENQPYRIPVLAQDDELREVHRTLRVACEAQRKVRALYVDEQRNRTERVL